MPKGVSIHIGLNAVNPDAYDGVWEGKLIGAVQDAKDMFTIAQEQGFQSTQLLEQFATRKSVIQTIRTTSETLVSGDILLLTYAGHGGTLPDLSGDESDRIDETWCLYDGHLLDDELHLLWRAFAEKVRIFVISDSCNSGTITRNASTFLSRAMPEDIAVDTQKKNRDLYRDIINSLNGTDISSPPIATVRLLAACKENATAMDGDPNGFFTYMLKKVWNNGHFSGDYTTFFNQINSQMHPHQTPMQTLYGQQNLSFSAQKPFQIHH